MKPASVDNGVSGHGDRLCDSLKVTADDRVLTQGQRLVHTQLMTEWHHAKR